MQENIGCSWQLQRMTTPDKEQIMQSFSLFCVQLHKVRHKRLSTEMILFFYIMSFYYRLQIILNSKVNGKICVFKYPFLAALCYTRLGVSISEAWRVLYVSFFNCVILTIELCFPLNNLK